MFCFLGQSETNSWCQLLLLHKYLDCSYCKGHLYKVETNLKDHKISESEEERRILASFIGHDYYY